MKHSVHAEAARDLSEISAFYRQSGSARVATRFLEEFERAVSLLLANPGFGTPFDLPRRIFPLRVFPYSVVYRPTEDGIRILAVRHQSRHPSHGRSRN